MINSTNKTCDNMQEVLFIFMHGASYGELASAVCDTAVQNETKNDRQHATDTKNTLRFITAPTRQYRN